VQCMRPHPTPPSPCLATPAPAWAPAPPGTRASPPPPARATCNTWEAGQLKGELFKTVRPFGVVNHEVVVVSE
jgi:hypothetical protein